MKHHPPRYPDDLPFGAASFGATLRSSAPPEDMLGRLDALLPGVEERAARLDQ
ncbi:hypothetical protein MVG78_16150 [Roseomonas gilardii subsp. gilardii]|uniref:hypothetical protein n=1 Tax=Roseomonas gilardii TaxID=257708 RepID=UPI001FF97122|nr:hypothetical protein [Roseomonas gilardii]UPG72044.1 hypothetical protein MVG78_16150 [Roseomonas gilardii subsp. gilardii]